MQTRVLFKVAKSDGGCSGKVCAPVEGAPNAEEAVTHGQAQGWRQAGLARLRSLDACLYTWLS